MSTFNVVLLDKGINILNTIKGLRAALYLGLCDAKNLVDTAPVRIASGASQEVVDRIRKHLVGVAGIFVETIDEPVYSAPKFWESAQAPAPYNPAAPTPSPYINYVSAKITVAPDDKNLLSASQLAIGEIVYRSGGGGPSDSKELRLVTSAGLYGLNGERGSSKDSNTQNYLRYSKGTTVVITL
jgi:hypothetical protein